MIALSSPGETQQTALKWKGHSKVVLVPTMGCLHEGHLELVRHAKRLGGRAIASLFVNPLQFGPGEDYERYPRALAADLEKLRSVDCDLAFHPKAEEMYPKGFATQVSVSGLTQHLCGRSRPGHFAGVTTVCLKLFEITRADTAIFGEKDFQQVRVIERMVSDLDLPLEIVRNPIIRETDGLALSSRNLYLSETERRSAASIPRALRQAVAKASVADVKKAVRETLDSSLSVEYIEVASEEDLAPRTDTDKVREIAKPRVFLAVRAGATRLIDNLSLEDT